MVLNNTQRFREPTSSSSIICTMRRLIGQKPCNTNQYLKTAPIVDMVNATALI